MADSRVTPPTWDNSSEYSGFQCDRLQADLQRIEELIGAIGSSPLNPEEQEPAVQILKARDLTRKKEDLLVLAGNIRTFAGCAASVDARDQEARAMVARIQKILAAAGEVLQPLNFWLMTTDEESIREFLTPEDLQPHAFQIERLRRQRPHLLSLAEESLLKKLEVNGITAWGNLYDQLSGTIECRITLDDGKEVKRGLARTAGMLEHARQPVRRSAWDALRAGWRIHEESCAAILNAMMGWRLELYDKRSAKKTMHFLDPALESGNLERATFDTMWEAVTDHQETGRRVLQIHKRTLQLEEFGPWDHFAPPPAGEGRSEEIPFPEALELIRGAFADFHPAMAEFVDIMVRQQWIEASVSEHKRPGAYCTKFPKSRTPRVYMTWTGGMKDVMTLAHELGHAFHNHVLREKPRIETIYPMTLAETASTFAESIVLDALQKRYAGDPGLRDLVWTDTRSAEVFLLNIPVRFQFERECYERRAAGPLTPDDFKEIMGRHWTNSYGDCDACPDELFWASKLHFYIAGLTFYNFPYTWGYLFSLGLVEHGRQSAGDFYADYTALLADTGRMTAEEVAQKHLGVDLRERGFWDKSLGLVAQKVDLLDQLC